jgi:O-antigen ligase
MGTVAEALEEGNTLDRTIWLGLILLSIAILLSRSFNWGDFVARNLALTAYLSFALMSILWSDFAFVAFKRWFRDLGGYFIILIVLSDPHPFSAVRTVLRRLCYLLIPLSIILIKYYINIGRAYDKWSGATQYVGVTTGKNLLGMLCVISGMFFFWDTLERWADRREPRVRQILFVNLGFGLMTLYLLRLAHSATCIVCLGVGCMVIAAADGNWGRRHQTLLKAGIPASFCLYLVLGFGLGLNADFAQLLGRDPTLTDRTHIWSVLLSLDADPVFGTGYESFWLGTRLESVHQKAGELINEAHNGYLEVYLNLGAVGVLLLVVFLVVGYRNICRLPLASKANSASFALGLWAVVILYNVTEASFRHGLMWLALLLVAVGLPVFGDNTEMNRVVMLEADGVMEETTAVDLFDWRG